MAIGYLPASLAVMAEYLNLNKNIIQPLNINQLQLQLVYKLFCACSVSMQQPHPFSIATG